MMDTNWSNLGINSLPIDAHVRVISHPASLRSPESGIIGFLEANDFRLTSFDRIAFNAYDAAHIKLGQHLLRIVALLICVFGNFFLSFKRDKKSFTSQFRSLVGELMLRVGREVLEAAFKRNLHKTRIIRDLNITEVHFAAVYSVMNSCDERAVAFIFEDDALSNNLGGGFPGVLLSSTSKPLCVDLSNSFSLRELNLQGISRRKEGDRDVLAGFITDSLCAYAYNRSAIVELLRALVWIRGHKVLRFAPVDFALNSYLLRFRNTSDFETVRLREAPFRQGSLE